MPTVITTFGEEYYEKWGRECIKSLVKYWPGKIIAYYEDKPPDEFTDRVEYRDLMDQEDLVRFLHWTKAMPLLQGIMPDGRYQYHYNAYKFCRKVFAISHHAAQEPDEPFFFVGADTRCLKRVPKKFLKGLLDGYPGAFLLRRHIESGDTYAHVESDFAGYDPTDAAMSKLLVVQKKSFLNGSFLELQQWHDCVLLDSLLDILGLTDRINNLSDGVKGEGLLGLNVWPNTILAKYMVHLKGMAKKGKEAA